MTELALKALPDLTMAEFAAGLEVARIAAAGAREAERTARTVGERWR